MHKLRLLPFESAGWISGAGKELSLLTESFPTYGFGRPALQFRCVFATVDPWSTVT